MSIKEDNITFIELVNSSKSYEAEVLLLSSDCREKLIKLYLITYGYEKLLKVTQHFRSTILKRDIEFMCDTYEFNRLYEKSSRHIKRNLIE